MNLFLIKWINNKHLLVSEELSCNPMLDDWIIIRCAFIILYCHKSSHCTTTICWCWKIANINELTLQIQSFSINRLIVTLNQWCYDTFKWRFCWNLTVSSDMRWLVLVQNHSHHWRVVTCWWCHIMMAVIKNYELPTQSLDMIRLIIMSEIIGRGNFK